MRSNIAYTLHKHLCKPYFGGKKTYISRTRKMNDENEHFCCRLHQVQTLNLLRRLPVWMTRQILPTKTRSGKRLKTLDPLFFHSTLLVCKHYSPVSKAHYDFKILLECKHNQNNTMANKCYVFTPGFRINLGLCFKGRCEKSKKSIFKLSA